MTSTMYRIYSEDNSKHYTAILLKDGSVLEVKNPDTNQKTKFPSLEAWRLSHSTDESGVIEDKRFNPVSNGFECPKISTSTTDWLVWCYKLIAEGAPKLLNRDDVKEAYNALVKVCSKYSNIIKFLYNRAENKYSENMLKWSLTKTSWYYGENKGEVPDKWCGFQAYFVQEYSIYYASTPKYNKEEYDRIAAEIVAYYKTLYDLISPELTEFMKRRDIEQKKKYKIMRLNADINRKKKKIGKLQMELQNEQNYLKKLEKELENNMKS